MDKLTAIGLEPVVDPVPGVADIHVPNDVGLRQVLPWAPLIGPRVLPWAVPAASPTAATARLLDSTAPAMIRFRD